MLSLLRVFFSNKGSPYRRQSDVEAGHSGDLDDDEEYSGPSTSHGLNMPPFVGSGDGEYYGGFMILLHERKDSMW